MIKDVTILTFDEVQSIRDALENMLCNARSGANGDENSKWVCEWLTRDLMELKEKFD